MVYGTANEVGIVPSEKAITMIQQATIYEPRRLLDNNDKNSYTKAELCKLLDTIAETKEQE